CGWIKNIETIVLCTNPYSPLRIFQKAAHTLAVETFVVSTKIFETHRFWIKASQSGSGADPYVAATVHHHAPDIVAANGLRIHWIIFEVSESICALVVEIQAASLGAEPHAVALVPHNRPNKIVANACR